MTRRLVWCCWGSAALTVTMAAIIACGVIAESFVVVAVIPTLVACVWVGRQTFVLVLLLRKETTREDADRSHERVFAAMIGVGLSLVLGGALLLFLGAAIGLVVTYAVLVAAEVALAVVAMQAIDVAYPARVTN